MMMSLEMYYCVTEMLFVILSHVLTAESGNDAGKAGLYSYDGQ